MVRFTPSRLWVITDGIPWACLAPDVWLDHDGRFVAQVTATDNDLVPWVYLVSTPAGCYECAVPWREDRYSLREVIRVRHPETGPPY